MVKEDVAYQWTLWNRLSPFWSSQDHKHAGNRDYCAAWIKSL